MREKIRAKKKEKYNEEDIILYLLLDRHQLSLSTEQIQSLWLSLNPSYSLPDHVEAKVLDSVEVPLHGLQGGRGVDPVRPEPLVQRSNLER